MTERHREAIDEEEEFILSEKFQRFEGWHSKENRFIHINNVKEFIRLLKEETRKEFRKKQTKEAREDKISCALLEDLYLKPFDKIIDKLAGEKLC